MASADRHADTGEKAWQKVSCLLGNTPRSRMVPVLGLTWLSTKLMVPWCGWPSSLASPRYTGYPPSRGESDLPSRTNCRTRSAVYSSTSK